MALLKKLQNYFACMVAEFINKANTDNTYLKWSKLPLNCERSNVLVKNKSSYTLLKNYIQIETVPTSKFQNLTSSYLYNTLMRVL